MDVVPITSVCLTLAMTAVFIAYSLKALVTLPCGNDVVSIIESQFVHVNFVHLASNLLALWYLVNIEHTFGSARFAALVVAIAVVSSVVDSVIGHRGCSIGFSGVVFGLFAWSALTTTGSKLRNIAVVAMLLVANIGPRVSLRSHAIGAASGAVIALCYNAIVSMVKT